MNVFVTEGIGLRIPAGGLSIGVGDDGSLSTSVKFEVSLEVWPIWLDTAIDHALLAHEERKKLQQLVDDIDDNNPDQKLQGQLLTSECKVGMVALASAAFALENFANVVQRFAPDIDRAIEGWTKARTPQHRRVAETLRRTFKMSNAGAQKSREMIAAIFNFRNWAVHPPEKFQEPIFHDLLRVGVEWRFMAFGAVNAVRATQTAASIMEQCIEIPRSTNVELVKWCSGAKSRNESRFERAKAELPMQRD